MGAQQMPEKVEPGSETDSARRLLRGEGRTMLIAAAATLVVELGVYVSARLLGAGPAAAALATLATATVWVALAAPCLAAGAASGVGAVLRGAVAADASCLALLVLWIAARDPETGRTLVPLLAVIKIYCTLAALAVAGVAVVRCGRTPAGRNALAVAAAIVFFIILAGPFWAGGLLSVDTPAGRALAARVIVYSNPFYAVTSTLAEQTGFVWHLSPVMYRLTRLGDYVPAPQPPWYAAAVVYACLAAIACGVMLLRPARRQMSPE